MSRNLRLSHGFAHETLPRVTTSIWFWVAFHLGVFFAIGIDLFTFRLRGRELSMAAAGRRSLVWVFVSLAFNTVVWRVKGPQHGLDFLTGYLIEYSLSMDNIFVFVLIFTHFRVPPRAQHRVLVWGIIGALIMRGTMILFGIALVSRFHFVLYIFGLFLLITAARMLFGKHPVDEFGETRIMRFCRRILPITQEFHDQDFKVRIDGRSMLTPLALTMIVIEITDLAFAVDSIPAIFAITQDPFIVYTSNICAILGLRSLYFLLAGLMNRFIYLRTGLALVLGFVGLKMITAEFLPFPRVISLAIIVLILGVTIWLSILKTRNGALRERPK